jgi:ferric-dicitrate binding protein FerR (iron transport regulator)
MKNNYQHIDPGPGPGNEHEDFFKRVEIPVSKNKEDIWADLTEKINETPSPRISIFKFRSFTYAIAASIILLAGIFSLLRFYTTTVYSPAGQHLSHTLPDGSTVTLNADSRISYRALWWRFARELNFEGEAYFNVQKGKKFLVNSTLGKTEVLGTSFNIFSRNEEYNVTCFTGQFKFTSHTSEEVVLTPEYEARVNASGNITVSKEMNSAENYSWVNNMFHFTGRPLPLVINEISRQFNVNISVKGIPDYYYTGYFSKDRTVEEILGFVCKPFGLTFAKISENNYEIYQN